MTKHVILFLLACGLAHGAVYYVATSGSDGADGSQATPWLSITNAAAKMTAGDTAIVSNGMYSPRVVVMTPGAAGNPITFTNAGGAIVNGGFSIRTNYITVHGFEIFNTNVTDGTSAASQQNGTGIYVYGNNVNIISNNVHDCEWSGIYIGDYFHSIHSTTNCLVLGNICRSNALNGIQVEGDDNRILMNDISWCIQYFWSWTNSGAAPDADGIRLFGTNNIVQSNYIHDIMVSWTNGGSYNFNPHVDAIQSWSESPRRNLNGAVVRDNIIYLTNWTASSISDCFIFQLKDTYSPSNITFINNICRAEGGVLTFGAIDVKIVNNVFHNGLTCSNYPSQQPFGLTLKSTNILVEGNIFVDCPIQVIDLSETWVTNYLASSNNIIYRTDGVPCAFNSYPIFYRTNDFWNTNALLVNIQENAVSDYHLTSNSLARGRAVAIPGFTTDADGRTRGATWDIGPYQYVAPAVLGTLSVSGTVNAGSVH